MKSVGVLKLVIFLVIRSHCARASSTFSSFHLSTLPATAPLSHLNVLLRVFTCLWVPEVSLRCFQAFYMFFTPSFRGFVPFWALFWVFELYVLPFFIFVADPHLLQAFCSLSHLGWAYSCPLAVVGLGSPSQQHSSLHF